jgi:pilus assembly protein Flp/PilA
MTAQSAASLFRGDSTDLSVLARLVLRFNFAVRGCLYIGHERKQRRSVALPSLRSGRRSQVLRLIVRFAKDETAATAIEYGLIAAGISLVIIAAVKGLGTKLNTTFTNINSSLR